MAGQEGDTARGHPPCCPGAPEHAQPVLRASLHIGRQPPEQQACGRCRNGVSAGAGLHEGAEFVRSHVERGAALVVLGVEIRLAPVW